MTTHPPPAQATKAHVYAAIAAITAALSRDGIAKARKNQDQNFNFRGIDDIYNSLSGLLAQHQLCIIPRVLSRAESQRQTKSGSVLNVSVVEVEYDIVSAIDGSRHTARAIGEAQDSADKSTNKAMSAAYKYLCLQLFCIPTESEDNDADATHTVAAPAPRQTPPRPAPQRQAAPTPAHPPDETLGAAARASCEQAGMTEAGIQALLAHYGVATLAELPRNALHKLATQLPRPDAVERFNLAGEHGDELPAIYEIQPQPQAS